MCQIFVGTTGVWNHIQMPPIGLWNNQIVFYTALFVGEYTQTASIFLKSLNVGWSKWLNKWNTKNVLCLSIKRKKIPVFSMNLSLQHVWNVKNWDTLPSV